MTAPLTITVNGQPRTVAASPWRRLLDVLREDLGLTGTKEGCGEGECGACSVMLGGRLVNSCLVPVAQVAGQEITTIEGLADGGGGDVAPNDTPAGAGPGGLHPVQGAFISHGGAQCGICTPGMILGAYALLRKQPAPSRDEIVSHMEAHLCRCGAHVRILDAIEAAAAAMRGGLR